jgi:hypothetical protein
MAVKVMWARALRPEVERSNAAATALPIAKVASVAERPAARQGEAKPKRRRSSVYDADGNEVFITLLCLKCHKTRPLSQFGLRRMADGAIRNQPWCRACRSEASPKKVKGERVEAVAGEDPAVSVGSPAGSGGSVSARGAKDAGLLAAEVAAALHRGRG